MTEVAHNVEQEFWRPPVVSQPSAAVSVASSAMVEACDRCETEFMVGARFCHACGATRPTHSSHTRPWTHHLDFQNIKERLGLSTPSLIAFVIGVGCILAAIAVGLLFTAQTVLDWQAVQVWRIQWLLASAAAFIAGILLNKSS
jgi:hypothetical protein